MTNTQALRQIRGHEYLVTLTPLAQIVGQVHSSSCACLTGDMGI